MPPDARRTAAATPPWRPPHLDRAAGHTSPPGAARPRRPARRAPRTVPQNRGGRKRCLETRAGREANFWCGLKDRPAGDPRRAESLWTDLTPGQIAEALAAQGTPVREPGVRQLLEEQGYGRRQAQKSAARGEHPARAAQFRTSARL